MIIDEVAEKLRMARMLIGVSDNDMLSVIHTYTQSIVSFQLINIEYRWLYYKMWEAINAD